MAAGLDFQGGRPVHFRPAVAPVNGLLRESLQDIYLGDDAAVALDIPYGLLDIRHECGVEPALKFIDGGFGVEYLLLVLLEFGCYVAFRVDERLLAHPVGRDLVFG